MPVIDSDYIFMNPAKGLNFLVGEVVSRATSWQGVVTADKNEDNSGGHNVSLLDFEAFDCLAILGHESL